MPRLAAVDVGSNTVHALVAETRGLDELEDIAHYVEMPELGREVAVSGRIGAAKTEEALTALQEVLGRARRHGWEHLVAGATAAVRRAADGLEFLRRAEAIAGVPVRLIGERREAELSFAGVASRHAWEGPWLMVDVGGASTELVAAEGKLVREWASLPLGSGNVPGAPLSDPPRRGERAVLRRAVISALEAAPGCPPQRLVVTGGTASNLPLVLSSLQPPSRLSRSHLLLARKRLDAESASTLAVRLGLPSSRVRTLRVGVEILLLLLDHYRLKTLQVTHRGLRHGMLLAYLERGEEWWR